MVQMNRESLVATKSSRERRSSASSRLQSCIQFILISGVIPFVFWSRHYIFLRSNVPDSDYNNSNNNNKYQDQLRNNNNNNNKFPHYGQFFRSYHYDDVLDKNNNNNNKLGDNKEAQRKKQRKQGYSLTKSILDKNEIVQRGGGDIAQLHYCQFPQQDRHLFWNNFSAWAVPILNQTQMQLWNQLEHTKKRITTKARIITTTTTNTKSLVTQSEQAQQQQRRQQEEKEPNEQEQQEQIMKQELLLQLLELYAQDHKLCDYNRYRPTLSMVEEEDDNNAEMMRLLNHLRHLTQQQSPPPPQSSTRTTTTTTTTTLLSPSFHTVSSSQSSSQSPRLVFSIVAHDDFPLLQRMIMALQQPQHVFLIHLERPRTNEAVQFQMAVRQWVNNNNKNNNKQQSTIATTTNVTNVFCITFGTIVYSTDTVSLIQWRILNWLLHDIKFTNFDYYITLDGASFPLWSPQDLVQQLVQSSASTTTTTTTTRTTTTKTTTTAETTAETDNTDKNDQVQPTSPHLVWLGPQLHKGKLLSITSESIASSSSSLTLQQQYLALLRRKRIFYTTHDTIKLTQRLPRALFGQQDISHNLLNALLVGGKSHSGNTAIYARSVVQQLVESAQVQELFALSKYVAYCCMQERTWRAALYLIHVQPDNNQQQLQSSIPQQQQQQQQQEEKKELLHGQEEEEHDDLATRNIAFFPPAVFQVYGSDTTTPGVCESSKRNAILITTIIKESETIIPTKLSHGNNNGTKSPLFCYKLDDATMVQHYHHLKQKQQEKAGHAVVEQGESNNKNNNKEEYSNKKDDLELLHYLHYWRNFNNQTDSELMTKNTSSSSSSSNNGGYTFWSNNTLAMLQQAKQLGFLFARKFDSSFHESSHLLDRIEQELW